MLDMIKSAYESVCEAASEATDFVIETTEKAVEIVISIAKRVYNWFVKASKVALNVFIMIVRSNFIKGARDFLRIYFPTVYTLISVVIVIEAISLGLFGWAILYALCALFYFAVTCSEIEYACFYREAF